MCMNMGMFHPAYQMGLFKRTSHLGRWGVGPSCPESNVVA